MKIKRMLLITLLGILFSPLVTRAETKTYEICKSNCQYNELLTVWKEINYLKEDYDVIINIKDEGPYSFLDGIDNYFDESFDEYDYEQYEVPLVYDPNITEGRPYYCDDNGVRVNLNNSRVIDYNTRDGICVLESEEDYKVSTYIINNKINSITINGNPSTKTKIDIVGAEEEGSLFAGFDRFFFTGLLNTKRASYNNIELNGSFYMAANTSNKPIINIDNCDFKYGVLAYNVEATISNSNLNRIYSLSSGTKVYLDTNNKYLNNLYVFPDLNAIHNDNSHNFSNDYTEEEEAALIERFYEYEVNNEMDFITNFFEYGISTIFSLLTNDVESTILLEIDNGRIIIMKSPSKIYLKLNETKDIKSALKNLEGTNYTINIKDPEILSILDGKIIPKSQGKTTVYVYAESGEVYKIEVEVDNQDTVINPKTGQLKIVIILLIFISLLVYKYVYKRKMV